MHAVSADKIKILISGRFGNLNMGDDAILLGMIESITGKIPDADFLVFADDPDFIKKYYNILSFPQWPVGLKRNFTVFFHIGFWVYLFNLIKNLKDADIFVLGGGGFLGGGFRQRSNFGVAPFWLSKMLLAQLLGKPTVIYGVGVGVIHRRLDRLLMRIVANRAKFITVRNEGSRENLIKCSIDKSKIQVMVDPALCYKPSFEHENAERRFLESAGVLSKLNGKPLIGFVLSPLWTDAKCNSESLNKEQIEIDGVIARCIELLVDKLDARILIFLMQYKEDRNLKSVVNDVFRRTEKKDNIFLIDRTFTPQQCADFISNLNVVVSMKLHPLIISSLAKVPFIAISTHFKIADFMSQIGMQDYVIDVQNISSTQIYDRVRHILNNTASINAMLDENVGRLREKAVISAQLLKDVIDNCV
jgi:polysaccharide pyruvyl transferase WcaK-like protein